MGHESVRVGLTDRRRARTALAADVGETLEGDGTLSESDASVESHRVAESPADPGGDRASDQRAGTYSAAGDRTVVREETTGSQFEQNAMGRFTRVLATLSGRRWTRSRAGDAADARRAHWNATAPRAPSATNTTSATGRVS